MKNQRSIYGSLSHVWLVSDNGHGYDSKPICAYSTQQAADADVVGRNGAGNEGESWEVVRVELKE